MKELLTLKEAAALVGRTTKTIKNYIRKGMIKNFFLVEGKFGQEYRISVKDLEPLVKKGHKSTRGKLVISPANEKIAVDKRVVDDPGDAPEEIYNRPEYQFVLRRNDEMLIKLGRCRERVEALEAENLRLKQDLGEKDMLIRMLSGNKASREK